MSTPVAVLLAIVIASGIAFLVLLLLLLFASLLHAGRKRGRTGGVLARHSEARDLLFRCLPAVPVALWAVGVLLFANEGGVGNEIEPTVEMRAAIPSGSDIATAPAVADGKAETRATTPFGSNGAAPVIVAARVVCSLANQDAAAASIRQFDGASSVVADGVTYWLFGDSWAGSGGGELQFVNATVAKSANTDAGDCVSLTYKASNGLAEPLFPRQEGEDTAWPDGAIATGPGQVYFYFASVRWVSSTEWHPRSIGLGVFDTATMSGRRLVEDLWDKNSGFGDNVNGARSPLREGDYVFVFLHTTTNRHLLARVRTESITLPAAYTYWDGAGWSGSPADAVSLWPESETVLPTHNGLSVRYNDFLGKWLAMYDRDLGTVSVRVSDQLTGPWSSEIQWLDCKTTFTSAAWPLCYYAEQHWQLARDGGRTIYVTVSSAPPYDVYLLEFRLGVAVHKWRDYSGGVDYSPVSPGDTYVDEGVSFYASDTAVPGFSPVYVWKAGDGERLYSTGQPGPDFAPEDIAFFAPTSSQAPGSMVQYEAAYRWDMGKSHVYSTATSGLERFGYVRGPVAFFAVCGDTNLDGVGDCLQ